jgi:hypothetical protein
LIDIYDFKDIKCANPQSVFSEESLAGAEIIARTIRGSACGFTKSLGKGTAIHLGTWIGYDTEGQRPVYEAILKKSTANLRQAGSNNYHISVRERFTNDGSAVLFVGNYYNEEHTAKVTYTHPQSGETISIPYMQNEMLWPPLYAILTPICLTITDGINILHSTTDILNIAEMNGVIEISLYGDRDLAGEIVFEGVNVSRIKSAKIQGEIVKMMHDKGRIILKYSHLHKKEMILTLKTN